MESFRPYKSQKDERQRQTKVNLVAKTVRELRDNKANSRLNSLTRGSAERAVRKQVLNNQGGATFITDYQSQSPYTSMAKFDHNAAFCQVMTAKERLQNEHRQKMRRSMGKLFSHDKKAQRFFKEERKDRMDLNDKKHQRMDKVRASRDQLTKHNQEALHNREQETLRKQQMASKRRDERLYMSAPASKSPKRPETTGGMEQSMTMTQSLFNSKASYFNTQEKRVNEI